MGQRLRRPRLPLRAGRHRRVVPRPDPCQPPHSGPYSPHGRLLPVRPRQFPSPHHRGQGHRDLGRRHRLHRLLPPRHHVHLREPLPPPPSWPRFTMRAGNTSRPTARCGAPWVRADRSGRAIQGASNRRCGPSPPSTRHFGLWCRSRESRPGTDPDRCGFTIALQAAPWPRCPSRRYHPGFGNRHRRRHRPAHPGQPPPTPPSPHQHPQAPLAGLPVG